MQKFNLKIKFNETNGFDIQTLFNDKKNLNVNINIKLQDFINNKNVADYYRDFLIKN